MEKEFEYNGIKLKVVPMDKLKESCKDCYFFKNDCGYSYINELRPACMWINREDTTDVIFVEVEDE